MIQSSFIDLLVTKEIAGYASGLFDGEGCINIRKSIYPKSRYQNPIYDLQITVKMASFSPPNFLKKHFGGSIMNVKENGVRRKAYIWQISGKKARPFLKIIYPYSLIKKEQIENAIEFQDHMEAFRRVFPKEHGGRSVSLPLEIMKYREKLFKKAKELKKNFH